MSRTGEAKLDARLVAICDELSKLLDEAAGEHVMFGLFTFGDGTPSSTGRFICNGDQNQVARAVDQCLNELRSRTH